MAEGEDARKHSPAAERNAEPILTVLRRYLPDSGRVLEVAAGTGQHAARFAAALPQLRWQPTDSDADALASIRAWRDHADYPNLAPPVELDIQRDPWPIEAADAVVCINLLHIAPWSVTENLMRGAGALLPTAHPLLIYGPFRIEGQHTADSNARFDQELQHRDARWGIRDTGEVAAVANAQGLEHVETVVMPANNRILAFRRR